MTGKINVSLNKFMTIKPNKKGIEYMVKTWTENYNGRTFSYREDSVSEEVPVKEWIESKIDQDGNFREQIHFIVSNFPDLFSDATDYLHNINLTIEL